MKCHWGWVKPLVVCYKSSRKPFIPCVALMFAVLLDEDCHLLWVQSVTRFLRFNIVQMIDSQIDVCLSFARFLWTRWIQTSVSSPGLIKLSCLRLGFQWFKWVLQRWFGGRVYPDILKITDLNRFLLWRESCWGRLHLRSKYIPLNMAWELWSNKIWIHRLDLT